MKTILLFVFLSAMFQEALSKPLSSNDSTSTKVDSLALIYPVRNISFMLDGKLVPYSKIFKEDGTALYEYVGGRMEPLNAIKHFGEKYRNGLFMYKRDERTKFHIDGVVDAKYDGALVTLFTITGNIIRSVDSTYVKSGRFSFQGAEYLYEKSVLSLGNYPDTVLSAELLLERGPIKVELGHPSVVHSPLALEYRQFSDSCIEHSRQINASLQKGKNVEELERRLSEYRYRFVKKHIHNGMGRGLFLEYAFIIPDSCFEELYGLLSERDRSRGDVRKIYEHKKKERAQQALAGKQYIDFTLVDTLGTARKISDYVGKSEALFIDFWASWCGPCRAQEPHLVRLYREYKSKGFEMMRISLDTDRNRWVSALKNVEGQWPELCVVDSGDERRIRELYSITGIPRGFILNKSGKILRVVYHWQELEWLLKAYYKN